MAKSKKKKPTGKFNYSTVIPATQSTYLNANGKSWNDDIMRKANELKKSGRNVYLGYDNSGLLHYSTKGQNKVNRLIGNYNSGKWSNYNYNGYNYAKPDESKVTKDTTYPDIYNHYASLAQGGYDDGSRALKEAMKATQRDINANYDNTARDYYKLYKSQTARLPETLSRLGMTGGASETAKLGLLNNYGTNVARGELARNSELDNTTSKYQNQIAQNSINLANRMSNAYLELAKAQVANNYREKQIEAERQAEMEQLKQQRAYENAVTSRNSRVSNRINQQLGKKGGREVWTWTDSDGGLHWTTKEGRAAQVKASAGANGIRHFKSTSTIPKKSKKKSSDSGSSRRRRKSSRRSHKTSSTSNAYDYRPTIKRKSSKSSKKKSSGSSVNQEKLKIYNSKILKQPENLNYEQTFIKRPKSVKKAVEKVDRSRLSRRKKAEILRWSARL